MNDQPVINLDQHENLRRLTSGRKELLILCLMALLSLGIGAGVNALSSNPLSWTYMPPAEQMAAASKHGAGTRVDEIRIINLQEVRTIVDQKSALILDARPDLFFEMGHLPGAISLTRWAFEVDYPKVQPKIDAALAEGRNLLVYCADVDCPDASTVAGWLREKQFGSILIFPGGWAEWEAAGCPKGIGH